MNFEAKGILTMIQQKEGKNGIYTVVTLLFNNGKTQFLYFPSVYSNEPMT